MHLFGFAVTLVTGLLAGMVIGVRSQRKVVEYIFAAETDAKVIANRIRLHFGVSN